MGAALSDNPAEASLGFGGALLDKAFGPSRGGEVSDGFDQMSLQGAHAIAPDRGEVDALAGHRDCDFFQNLNHTQDIRSCTGITATNFPVC